MKGSEPYKRRMTRLDLLNRIADLAACLRLFSRLQVPALVSVDDPADLPALPRAAAMMPLAGGLLALPAALGGGLLALSALPEAAIGFIMLVLLVMPTGALHEDGLADTADGLFGGRDRERRLAIMKDSRIGSFGALALILSTGLRAIAYGHLARMDVWLALAVPVAAGAFGRLAMVWLWLALPSARPDGLAAAVGRPDRPATALATVIGLLLAVPLMTLLGSDAVLTAMIFAVAAVMGLRALARAKIGGQTGDILGATVLVAETVMLVGLCV